MIRRFLHIPENATPKMRSALRYTSIIALATLLVFPVYIYLIFFKTNAWQLWAAASIVIGVFAVSLISRRLIQDGNTERGAQVLIYGLLFALVANPFLIADLGIVLGITAVALTVVIASQIAEKPDHFIVTSFVVGAIAILLDLFLPPYRLIVPELQIVAPITTTSVVLILGFMTFRRFQDFSLRTKLLLLGIISVVITALTLIAVVVWQSNQYNALAENQFDELVEGDLGHITEGVYNMVVAQDELVQQMVDYNLNVARQELNAAGPVSFGAESVRWTAINQFSQESIDVQLPKMLVGDVWLGQNKNVSSETLVVDKIQNLVGGTSTIFQRMNEQGDMLRVATNVQNADGRRAIGTYIPVTMLDGTPNPVVTAVLSGKTYRGTAYVVNAWYDAAYEPIFNEAGKVVGMLFVGVKQQNVESLREAIIRTRIGETGYVYVLGSEGNDRGHYIISQNGERDGEDIWETQDAEGNYIIQSIVNKAVALKPGEMAVERYLWQNPGDPAPRWKIARIAYYEPWHWVIAASTYEDELESYRGILQGGQQRMITMSGAIGLAVALVMSFLSILMAGSISRPVGYLANVATQIAGGNLDVAAKVEQQDEIGALAGAFNNMTDKLRQSFRDLDRRATQLATVAEISTATSTLLETNRLLQEVVDLTKERFTLYHSHIYLLDETGENLVLASGAGEPGREMMAKGFSIPLDREQSLVARAARERRGVTVNDVTLAPDFLPNPLLPDTRSELAVPMIVGGTVIGVFDIQSDQVGRFTDEDINIQTTLAAQIATSIQNVRQFEASKSQADLESLANEIGQRIQRTTTIEQTLQTAIRELGTVLGASRVSARIGGTRSTVESQPISSGSGNGSNSEEEYEQV
jgi:putative methionine-R-sulfoxide reductase with GAF domain